MAVFALSSLHRKNPFLTRVSETGSTTGWGLAVRTPAVSTIQFHQTAETVVAQNVRVLRGYSLSLVRLPVAARVSRLARRILASGLCPQKFRSRRPGFSSGRRQRRRSCLPSAHGYGLITQRDERNERQK